MPWATAKPIGLFFPFSKKSCRLELGSRADLTQGVAVIAWQLRPSWGESVGDSSNVSIHLTITGHFCQEKCVNRLWMSSL